jgi:Transposase zinc-binding domain/Putative transposase
MSHAARTAPTVIASNSCRNRHCPKCQGAAAREWMAAREAELLPVAYFHVVFTVPAAIGDIAYHNKAVIYDLLFKASAQTMLTIAADPKHLGARIGITAVVRTWGSAMIHHPHIHMIVRAAGSLTTAAGGSHARPTFCCQCSALQAVPAIDAGEACGFGHARHRIPGSARRRNTATAPLIQCRSPDLAPTTTSSRRLNGFRLPATPRSNRHSARHRLTSTSRGFLVWGFCCQVVSTVSCVSFFCSTAPQAFFRPDRRF